MVLSNVKSVKISMYIYNSKNLEFLENLLSFQSSSPRRAIRSIVGMKFSKSSRKIWKKITPFSNLDNSKFSLLISSLLVLVLILNFENSGIVELLVNYQILLRCVKFFRVVEIFRGGEL